MNLIERYVKEFLLERNFKKHFKKPFDYDLLIFNMDINEIYDNKASPWNIYKFFKGKDEATNRSHDEDFILSVKSGIDNNNNAPITKHAETDIVFKSLKASNSSIIELRKDDNVIEILKSNFKFNFFNCNLNDNKPILCVPLMRGNDVEGRHEDPNNRSSQAIHQKAEPERINWLLHDLNHLDSITRSGGTKLSDFSKVLPGEEHFTGSSMLSVENEFFLKIMLAYFKEISYTEGLEIDFLADVVNSVYAYCLNSMSRANDANKIDFTNLNVDGEPVTEEQSVKVQEWLSKCYKKVHENSELSRIPETKLESLKNMFLLKKGKNYIGKLKDGSIYIHYIMF